jgi:hypothetical protein
VRVVLTILAALWKAVRRGGKSVGSFASNNIFVLSVTLLVFKDPGGFVSLNVLMAVVLFFPLSADPLRKVPAMRLAIWPLGRGERGLLRILAVWLNPIAWVLALLVVRKAVTLDLWAVLAVLFAIAFLAPGRAGSRRSLWRGMPHVPGPLDQLIRKNLREALTTLDFYCALLLSAFALGFRCAGRLPREAFLPMSLAVTLALSTYAASLFGLDGESGMTRYRLLPIPAWQVLAAKDAAFLLIALALTLPLSPVAGLAAGLIGLAYGHYASVTRRRALAGACSRWWRWPWLARRWWMAACWRWRRARRFTHGPRGIGGARWRRRRWGGYMLV